MTNLSDDCAALTLTRRFPHPPATVWAAFTEFDRRKAWFSGPPGGTEIHRSYDFRPGGEEDWAVKWQSGLVTRYHARFHAIEPETRVTYVFDLYHGTDLFSISLTDVTLTPTGDGGTELVMMEALAYYAEGDRADMHANRIEGTTKILETLGGYLADTAA